MKRFFEKLKKFFNICPGWHTLLLVSGALVILFSVLRRNRELMVKLSDSVVRHIHSFLAILNSQVDFSVAEILIILLAVIIVLITARLIFRLIFRRHRLRELYRWLMTLVSLGMAVYACFCLLWGVYYYGESFIERSGLDESKISVEQLADVTEYFARMANRYSGKVERNSEGVYSTDFEKILDRSDEVYRNTVKVFPCLDGPEVKAKGFIHSRFMSYTDFTGFFFPFTAEANVNTDIPAAYFASTVAHELSHQRGIAEEQYANFAAVVACLNYGDPDYVYSACLLAYCHLGNALHDADYERWCEIYSMLNEDVQADFEAERAYWKQFETPVETVSNTVYENFLYSYDQELGLKSYGACVDFLVNYYWNQIK